MPELRSRLPHIVLNPLCEWMRATEHAPRDPCRILERRYGLAEIIERGAVDLAERLRVNRPHHEHAIILFEALHANEGIRSVVGFVEG